MNVTIIRLIDVVLNLLFGFICISEIGVQSKINLPESTQAPFSNPDKEEIIFVGITSSGQFLVENETKSIGKIHDLEQYLLSKKAEYQQRKVLLRVRIRSNWNTPIKYTMAVADRCDRFGIPKGMDVRRKGAGLYKE